jgi:hypothetical protein
MLDSVQASAESQPQGVFRTGKAAREMIMAKQVKRGSEKLLAAWKSRSLTEDSVREIADAFAKSPATVESAYVVGGANPTGLRVSLRYDGDDGPWCGNDILFWLKWHWNHGGVVVPPKIIINGTPWPDLIRVQFDFGQVGDHVPVQDAPTELETILG